MLEMEPRASDMPTVGSDANHILRVLPTPQSCCFVTFEIWNYSFLFAALSADCRDYSLHRRVFIHLIILGFWFCFCFSISFKDNIKKWGIELGRWPSSWEHWLLFQRPWFQFSIPTWLYTTIVSPLPGNLIHFSGPECTWFIDVHIGKTTIHIK